MEEIIAMLDNMDLSGIMPDIGGLVGKLGFWMQILVMVGPLVLMLVGLSYLLLAPKEANYRMGFRTYWGMGSVKAWRFTQRLAGIAVSGLGLVLTVVMFLVSRKFADMPVMDLMNQTIACLLWEIGATAFVYFGISVTAFVLFDADGYRRTYNRNKPPRY